MLQELELCAYQNFQHHAQRGMERIKAAVEARLPLEEKNRRELAIPLIKGMT